MQKLSTYLIERGLTKAPGTIISYSSNAVPAGWLICDGSALNALVNPQYQRLYDAIGNTYGGSNNTNFQLPDLRGQFLRGLDHSPLQGSKGIDNGRTLGSIQAPQMSEHTHSKGSIGVSSSSAPHTHLSNPTNNSTVSHSHTNAYSALLPDWLPSGPAPSASPVWYTTVGNMGTGTAPFGHTHDQTNTSTSGNHSHDISTFSTTLAGASSNNREMRPVNTALFFLIKI